MYSICVFTALLREDKEICNRPLNWLAQRVYKTKAIPKCIGRCFIELRKRRHKPQKYLTTMSIVWLSSCTYLNIEQFDLIRLKKSRQHRSTSPHLLYRWWRRTSGRAVLVLSCFQGFFCRFFYKKPTKTLFRPIKIPLQILRVYLCRNEWSGPTASKNSAVSLGNPSERKCWRQSNNSWWP